MISSRRQSHYREAMVFEDDWGNSASEREVSSPWIQRRK